MTTPDRRTRDLVCAIAERRALGWQALQEAFGPPTTQTVLGLCEGTTHAALVHATAWLASDLDRFDPDLALLDAYGRGACARTVEDVLDELTAEHARLFAEEGGLLADELAGDPDRLVPQLAAMTVLVQREREAWADADVERAKQLRTAQREFLLAHPARFVPTLTALQADTTRLNFYRAFAGLLRSNLSIEAGVDYGRTVLSQTFEPKA